MTENYLDHLQNIADEDVRELMRKEKTYKGSWKKRGGVGAFMMLARKWDRLENILSQETVVNLATAQARHQYDLFDAIVDEPSGVDGSVLAEVRDLRRYLLLVEAEMTARGTISAGAGSPSLPTPGTPEDGGHHARFETPEDVIDFVSRK